MTTSHMRARVVVDAAGAEPVARAVVPRRIGLMTFSVSVERRRLRRDVAIRFLSRWFESGSTRSLNQSMKPANRNAANTSGMIRRIRLMPPP
jgi:hypothetical protein